MAILAAGRAADTRRGSDREYPYESGLGDILMKRILLTTLAIPTILLVSACVYGLRHYCGYELFWWNKSSWGNLIVVALVVLIIADLIRPHRPPPFSFTVWVRYAFRRWIPIWIYIGIVAIGGFRIHNPTMSYLGEIIMAFCLPPAAIGLPCQAIASRWERMRDNIFHKGVQFALSANEEKIDAYMREHQAAGVEEFYV